jgi:shikimate kinase
MKKNNIILIGFMGCGKTSVGIRLSYKLRRAFLDTDKWIEQKQKKAISDIFASEGEAAFRQMEKDCIRGFIEKENNKIISTGGGLPVQEGNCELLKKLGKVYYLRVTPETVYERLKNDTSRPLLAGENPMVKIESLLAQRTPLYEACADVIIDVDGKSFEEILEEIAEKERGV